MQTLTGQLQQAVITIGRAAINVAGTYQTSGPTTAINLKVNTQVCLDRRTRSLPSLRRRPSAIRLSPSGRNPHHQPQRHRLHRAIPSSTAPSASTTPTSPALTSAPNSGPSAHSPESNPDPAQPSSPSAPTSRINGGNVRTDNALGHRPRNRLSHRRGNRQCCRRTQLQRHPQTHRRARRSQRKGGAAAGAGGIAGQFMGMIPSGAAGGTAGSVIGNYAGAALRNGVPVAIGGTTSNPTFTPNMGGIVNSATSGAATKGAPKALEQQVNRPALQRARRPLQASLNLCGQRRSSVTALNRTSTTLRLPHHLRRRHRLPHMPLRMVRAMHQQPTHTGRHHLPPNTARLLITSRRNRPHPLHRRLDPLLELSEQIVPPAPTLHLVLQQASCASFNCCPSAYVSSRSRLRTICRI